MVTRKLQFSGFLFDGKSAQKHPVRIELTPHYISLTQSSSEKLNWFYPNLRWMAETTPFNIEHEVSSPEGKLLQTLVVEDPEFLENCTRISPDNFLIPQKHTSLNWKFFTAGLLILILFLYGALKVFPDYLVDQFVDEIPVEWEERLGDAVLTAFPVEKKPDPKVISLLQDILRLLKQSMSEETPYNLKIFILKTKEVNALALPGGNIIVFEGLLKIADSPEELAGVLAHEVQHIFLKHSTKGIIRNLASGMLMALVVGDANVVLDGVLSMAGELNTLGLSRKMELEADSRGVELMLQAKINPEGMITIFEKLLEKELEIEKKASTLSKSEDSSNWFSYLSTHPSAEIRIKNLNKQIRKNKGKIWIPLYPDSQWNKIKPKD
ncbi:MAG: M48 family metallopeptidase [Nitrospinota bacterium]